MALAVKEEEALDPVNVALLGAREVVFEADAVANLLQELFEPGFQGFFQWLDRSWGGAILVYRTAKSSTLKPDVFRLLQQLRLRVFSFSSGRRGLHFTRNHLARIIVGQPRRA